MRISGFYGSSRTLPDIVLLAEDFPVTHEASALLVQKLLAYTTLEASRMPLQVGCHT